MKKLLALLLALVMVLSMVACGEKEEPAEETEKEETAATEAQKETDEPAAPAEPEEETIYGVYTAELDFAQFAGEESAEMFADANVAFEIELELVEDGTYTLAVTNGEEVADALLDAMIEMMKAEMVTEGMTWEETLAAAGTTEEELRTSFAEEINADALTEEMNEEGTFEETETGLLMDGEQELKLVDGALVMEEDGITVTFEK